jgi:hypothetical protein
MGETTSYVSSMLAVGTSNSEGFDFLVSGGTKLKGNLSVTGQIVSTVADGTPPMTVDSTTKVVRLNSDYVDDCHAGHVMFNVPINDGTLNTALNADQLDGKHETVFALADGSRAFTGDITKPATWNIRPATNNTPNIVAVRGGTGDGNNTGQLDVYAGSDGGVAARLMGNSFAGQGTSYINSGYIALGTTTANGYPIYLNGSTYLNGDLYKGGTLNIKNPSTTAQNIVNITAGTDTTSDNQGVLNVAAGAGYGTALHIEGHSYNGPGVSYITNGWFAVGSTSSDNHQFYVNGDAAFSGLKGTGNRTVYSQSDGTLTNSSSDIRLKKNIVSISDQMDVLASLKQLRGVYYNWDTSLKDAKGMGDQREMGMIAQEVEKVLPEVIGTNPDGYKSLDYPKLTGYLIEVCKAQQKEIEEQKKITDEQNQQLEEQKKLNEEMKARLDKLEEKLTPAVGR